jgi:hypothetical protein
MLFQPPPEAAQGGRPGRRGSERKASTPAKSSSSTFPNTSLEPPADPPARLFGIDMSVTKHVLMLWIVAAILFFGVTWLVRRYLKQDRLIPGRITSLLEICD